MNLPARLTNRLHAGLSGEGEPKLPRDDVLAVGLKVRSDGAFDGEGDGFTNSIPSILLELRPAPDAGVSLSSASEFTILPNMSLDAL